MSATAAPNLQPLSTTPGANLPSVSNFATGTVGFDTGSKFGTDVNDTDS